jgi:hypothetical protein
VKLPLCQEGKRFREREDHSTTTVVIIITAITRTIMIVAALPPLLPSHQPCHNSAQPDLV